MNKRLDSITAEYGKLIDELARGVYDGRYNYGVLSDDTAADEERVETDASETGSQPADISAEENVTGTEPAEIADAINDALELFDTAANEEETENE